MTSPAAVSQRLDEAIERATTLLLSCQAPDGHWVGETEATSTITSEYLLFCHLVDRVDRERERKIVTYLREHQLRDGGFGIYEKGPANVSATIKAYFAMKVADTPPDDPALVAARERILALGGPPQADVFTKILLALLDEYDWAGVPSMPVANMVVDR